MIEYEERNEEERKAKTKITTKKYDPKLQNKWNSPLMYQNI
jgi:hypothetical protein